MSTVKLSEENKNLLDDLSKKYNMNRGVLIGYLCEQAIKYEMFDPDWVWKIVQAEYNDRLKEAELDLQKKYNQDNYRAILTTKQLLVKEYLKVLPPEERRSYIETALGLSTDTNGANLLEDMTSYQMYSVNGSKRMLPPGAEGQPRLPGIAPSKLIRCPKGWHIVDDPCGECANEPTCEIRIREYTDWVAVHGSKRQQDEWLRRHG